VVGEEDPSYPEAERLLWLADLPRRLETEAVGGPEADLQRYRHAAGAFFSGDMELALETWLELVGKNRELDADGARRALVAAFVALGPDHALTRTYRPRLASAIY
jgi:putative thioredoxin